MALGVFAALREIVSRKRRKDAKETSEAKAIIFEHGGRET